MTFRRAHQAAAVGCVLSVLVLGTHAVAAQPAAAPPAPAVTAGFTSAALNADLATLAAPGMEGRRTGTPGNAKARDFILERFKSLGLTPLGRSFSMPFRFNRNGTDIDGVNVVGVCRGSGGGDDGVMVISAHYDHLGVRDGQTFHGADDNASGVAVLLALARHCQQSPWTHDVVFAAFDAEEMGLQGARAFVAKPPIALERIRLNVNLDMVARGDKRQLFVAGTSHTPELKNVLGPTASRAPIQMLFGHDQGTGQDNWTTQSDHGAFHAAGIPFVYFGVEDHADYHKPTDTADKVNPGFFFQAATTILDAVTALDRALPAPRR